MVEKVPCESGYECGKKVPKDSVTNICMVCNAKIDMKENRELYDALAKVEEPSSPHKDYVSKYTWCVTYEGGYKSFFYYYGDSIDKAERADSHSIVYW